MLRLTTFILRHPGGVLAGMVVLIGLGVWQRTRLTTSQTLQALVVQGDRRRQVFERMRRDFGDDEVLAVAVEADSVYRREVLETIDGLCRWLKGLEGVGEVVGVTTLERLRVRRVMGVPVGVVGEPLYHPGGDPARLRDYIRAHPLHRRRLISADERAALVVVRFEGGDRERVNAVVRRIRAGIGRFEREGVRLWLAGYPLIRSELIRASREDVDRLLYVALAVVVVVLVLAFRRAMPVVLSAVVIVCGVVVATGAIAALGVRMNNLLAMVPALVLIIGSSTSMHLLTRYVLERGRGVGVESAVARALIHTGPGCFWASATTAVGFLGLMVSRVPALRQCGFCSAMGVGLSFVVAVGLIPTALVLFRRGAGGWEPGPADLTSVPPRSRLGDAVAGLVGRHARAIVVVAAGITLASIYGITRLRVETNRLDYFRPRAPLRRAYRRIEERFGGLTEIDVLLVGEQPNWLGAGEVRRLERLEGALERVEGVDGALALPDLIKHANQVLGGSYALPGDDVTLQHLLRLVRAGGGRWWRMFVSRDRRTCRVLLFTRWKGSAHLEDLIGRVGALAGRLAPGGTRVEVSGSAVVFAGMARYVVAGQVRGLLAVMVILLVIMVGLVRRVLTGLVCLLPTVVPVLMLYGLMSAAGIPLNIHTSIVSALAAGIAIDNAIHFLSAFKRSFRRVRDYPGAVGEAIVVVARPLVVNCLIVAGGLGAFTQADLLAVAQVGVLLGVTMVNALIMGLFLLPALLLVLRPGVG